ncbi:MAG TPA: kelch repeat-containing protein [Myxococcota bacterium]|nr:kelch repeat-containing protein [Myxococcota bacterium]
MRNPMTIAGLAALLFAACGSGDGEMLCDEGAGRCNGTVIEDCTGGAWIAGEDCDASEMNCKEQGEAASCTDRPPICTDGKSRCSADLIENCTGGAWTAGIDCAENGKICVMDQASGEALCREDVIPCVDGTTRCLNDIIETCAGEMWVGGRDCSQTFQNCVQDPGSPQADCAGLHWIHLEVLIDDPIVNGSSLQLPIDGPSFGYDPGTDLFATRYDRDFNDPSKAFIWTLDGGSGSHYKTDLSGDPFPQGESFCVGGEDWCQIISFDGASSEWVFVGPSASSLMRVDAFGTAALTPTSGERQPDSFIDRIHRFDWTGRQLLLYGATGPSSFSENVYSLDLDTGVWSQAVSNLRQEDNNCLVYLAETGVLYSFGGRETQDGGNTVQLLPTYDAVDLAGGSVVTADMPAAIGARQAMNCAYDSGRKLIFLYGGCVVNDRFDEIQNAYHNDLWALDPADGSWTQLMPDTEPGTFSDPDQYGDHRFTGDDRKPNFGMNRGQMQYDAQNDRLIIMGEVPIFTHAQPYFLYLDEL